MFLILDSQSNSKVSIILSFKAKWYNPHLWFEARPYYLAPSEKLAMFGHVNKALLKQVKVVDQKICDVVLDPDLSSFLIELLKFTGINNYTINLIEIKQIFYDPIYSLRLIELETLKTYIETNFTKGFIWSSKSTRISKLIFLKAANFWITWAIPDVVFHPVRSDKRITLEKHLWRQ